MAKIAIKSGFFGYFWISDLETLNYNLPWENTKKRLFWRFILPRFGIKNGYFNKKYAIFHPKKGYFDAESLEKVVFFIVRVKKRGFLLRL